MAKQKPIEETAVVETPTITCLMQCTNVADNSQDGLFGIKAYMVAEMNDNPDGSGNGNEGWTIVTPAAGFYLGITNEEKKDFFESGKHYRVTITPVEPVVTPLQ